jgi:hypothetical protein
VHSSSSHTKELKLYQYIVLHCSGILHRRYLYSRAVVPNLWYAYLLGYAVDRLRYAKIILVMAENTKKKKS